MDLKLICLYLKWSYNPLEPLPGNKSQPKNTSECTYKFRIAYCSIM